MTAMILILMIPHLLSKSDLRRIPVKTLREDSCCQNRD